VGGKAAKSRSIRLAVRRAHVLQGRVGAGVERDESVLMNLQAFKRADGGRYRSQVVGVETTPGKRRAREVDTSRRWTVGSLNEGGAM